MRDPMCGSAACRYNDLSLLLNPEEEEPTQPDDYDDDLLEALMLVDGTTLSDEDHAWSVYRGLDKPVDDAAWVAISAFCRNKILLATNVEVDRREWRDAYVDEFGV